jgi:hypothetical protein
LKETVKFVGREGLGDGIGGERERIGKGRGLGERRERDKVK